MSELTDISESIAAYDKALERLRLADHTEEKTITPFSELNRGAQLDLVADYLFNHPEGAVALADASAVMMNVTGEELMDLALNGTKTEIADWLHDLAIGQFAKRIDRERGL